MVSWYLIALVAAWWVMGMYAAYRAFPASADNAAPLVQPDTAAVTERKLAA